MKPTKISAELAKFLGLSEGELISRPNVTKRINEYATKHELKNEKNKREFILSRPGGEALMKLLNVPADATVTLFTIQTYLKPHFIKEPKVEKEPKEKKAKAPKAETEKAPKAAKPTAKASKAKAAVVEEVEEAEEEAEPVIVKKAAAKTKKVAPAPVEEEAPVEEVKPRRRRTAEAAA